MRARRRRAVRDYLVFAIYRSTGNGAFTQAKPIAVVRAGDRFAAAVIAANSHDGDRSINYVAARIIKPFRWSLLEGLKRLDALS